MNLSIRFPRLWSLPILFALSLYGAAFAAEPDSGKVTGAYSVIHTVANLEKSAAFYRDVVGLSPDASSVFASGGGHEIQALTNAPGARVISQSFQIPGSELHLVLLQFSGIEQKHVDSHIQDPGVVKLVIRVRDMDMSFAAVHALHLPVYSTGGAPVHPEGPEQRVQAVILRDPDGFALEFVLANEDVKTTAPAASNVVGGWASLVIEDLGPTLKFYGEQLGFKINNKRPLPPSVLALEGTPDASVTNVGTRPPGSNFTWFIYDFRNIDRKTLHSRIQDVGSSSIALLATNLPSLLDSMKKAGVKIESSSGAPLNLDSHTKAVFIRDPSGIPIELVERSE